MVGGQMGFFLGASVLTVAELCELCVVFTMAALRRLAKARNKTKPANAGGGGSGNSLPAESKHWSFSS